MGDGWDQIAEEEGDLSFRFDLDALMAAGVARRDDGGDPGQQFGVAVQEFPLISVRDRREVVSPIAGLGPFVGSDSVFILAMLNHVPGFGKAGISAPRSLRIVLPPAWSK